MIELLCVYLWLCGAIGALMGLSIIRPVHWGDVLMALAFPLLFPLAFVREVIRRYA